MDYRFYFTFGERRYSFSFLDVRLDGIAFYMLSDMISDFLKWVPARLYEMLPGDYAQVTYDYKSWTIQFKVRCEA